MTRPQSGNILLAPSILNADFTVLGQEIQSLLDAGVDWIHLDVMDGVFVPNLSFAFPVLHAVKKITDRPVDAHLMITHPERYAGKFAEAGAEYVTIHPEAEGDIHQALRDIRDAGGKPGLAIKPDTPVSIIEPYLKYDLKLVLIMSVEPGFGGQSFREYVLPKFNEARELLGEDCLLEIDGGINADTVGPATAAGCEVFVVGTTLMRLPPASRADMVLRLRENAKSALRDF